jgi:hypothetical protein
MPFIFPRAYVGPIKVPAMVKYWLWFRNGILMLNKGAEFALLDKESE